MEREARGATTTVGYQARTSMGRAALAISLLVLSALSAASLAAVTADPAARVLLVNSYGPNARWSIELAAGVREALATHFPSAVLTVTSAPTDTTSGEDPSPALCDYIRQEHARGRFALAIAADDAAFLFILKFHDQVLPGVPVVFCGVSDIPPETLERHRLITGTLQVRAVSTAMATALKRHPDTRALVVVHDLSPMGLAYREQVQSWTEEILRHRPRMVVAFLSAGMYSTEELVEQVRALPPDSLVLMTSWSRDRDGHPQQCDDVLASLARVSPVPVYGITGSGAGFVPALARFGEANRQGEIAGTMAAKILQGVPPAEIPVRIIRSTPELESVSSIEAGGTAAASRPAVPSAAPPLAVPYSLSGIRFWLLCGLAAGLQAASVGILILAIRRHRRAQHDAEDLRHRLSCIVESAGMGVFEWDLATGSMSFNADYAEMLGFLPEDIEPSRRHWETMVHPDDRHTVLTALQDYLDDRTPNYALCYRMLTRAGTYRRVHERGRVTVRNPDGSPRRFLGVHVNTDVPVAAPSDHVPASRQPNPASSGDLPGYP